RKGLAPRGQRRQVDGRDGEKGDVERLPEAPAFEAVVAERARDDDGKKKDDRKPRTLRPEPAVALLCVRHDTRVSARLRARAFPGGCVSCRTRNRTRARSPATRPGGASWSSPVRRSSRRRRGCQGPRRPAAPER